MADANLANVYVTILAGGSGTRLWPMSRQATPKQLLALVGDRSLLQQTIDRVLPLVPAERIYILTGPDHAAPIAAQIEHVLPENIMIEYSPRGTAPCLGLAAMRLAQRGGPEAVMLSLHADHVVRDEPAFREALLAAIETAHAGHLVTMGIIPEHPDTGFGYIERQERFPDANGLPVYQVSRFTEKPPLDKAEQYVASGRYYWNTGYFCWRLGRICDEFRASLPETAALLAQMVATDDDDAARALWERIPRNTIDVGIMEQAADVAVVPADIGWSDIGNWSALYQILGGDGLSNINLTEQPHRSIDSSGCLLAGSGTKLVATIGVDDLVIVDTGDALLVIPKDRAQDVGQLVKQLRAEGLDDYL